MTSRCTWCGGPRKGVYYHCTDCQRISRNLNKAKIAENWNLVKKLTREKDARKDPTLYHLEQKPENKEYVMRPKGRLL